MRREVRCDLIEKLLKDTRTPRELKLLLIPERPRRLRDQRAQLLWFPFPFTPLNHGALRFRVDLESPLGLCSQQRDVERGLQALWW